jgi:hypothetical protein
VFDDEPPCLFPSQRRPIAACVRSQRPGGNTNVS